MKPETIILKLSVNAIERFVAFVREQLKVLQNYF